MVPRVQVANKLHEGRARASHSLHASLQTVDKPHCNGRGSAHARPTMLCINLVHMSTSGASQASMEVGKEKKHYVKYLHGAFHFH